MRRELLESIPMSFVPSVAHPSTPRPRTKRTPLVVLAAVVLGGCGGGGGGGGGAPTSPLFVTAVDPADGSSHVTLTAHVRVTFSLPLNPATVTSASIAVGNTLNGAVIGNTALDPTG